MIIMKEKVIHDDNDNNVTYDNDNNNSEKVVYTSKSSSDMRDGRIIPESLLVRT